MPIEILILAFIFIFFCYILAKSFNQIFKFFYVVRTYFSPKLQKFFYAYEKYSLFLKIGKKKYLKINNFIFEINKKKNFNKLILKLNKNIKKIIIIFFSKESSYFHYKLDQKKYNKKIILNDSINFFSIEPDSKKSLQIAVNKNDFLVNKFFIKKNEKKKLVLFFLVDGLSNNLTRHMKFTKNYFGKNNQLDNMWANAPWTLPSFSNLISGKYTSNHLNYKHFSNYKSYLNLEIKDKRCKINADQTIFETFKKSGFVTGCYSPYQRINPTYDFDRGVDILRYCEKQSSDELIDNIISQIEMFKDTSNFIFAHSFDTHGAVKDYHRLSDFAYEETSNKDYKFFDSRSNENKIQKNNLTKKHLKFVKNKTLSEQNNLTASFKYNDLRLKNLYNYIDSLKLDDYTIIVFGDHGTRFANLNKSGNLLSNSQVNVGLFIKDKKFKSFKNKKNKPLQTIDFFPSLIDRYSLKTNFKELKNFDGTNSIFSQQNKEYIISESVYEPEYHLKIIYKNIFLYSVYKFENFSIKEHKYRRFHDKNEKNYAKNITIIKKLIEIEKMHIKKNKLKKI